MGSQPIGIYSASGISAILGLNQYTTPLHAWQNIMEKLKPGFNAERGFKLPEFPDNAPIRWGHGFEDAIIKLAEEKEGCEIIDRERLFTKNIGDIMLSCHIDGAYNDISGNYLILHEGKTTNSRAFYSVKGEDYDDQTGEIEFKRRWGDPLSDEVPMEYTVQCAIQRIVTGAELVKLSVLVFPKSTQDFEDLGWNIIRRTDNDGIVDGYWINRMDEKEQYECFEPFKWAKIFDEIGNFHTYNLPTNKPLESLIIEKIQEFDAKYVKTEVPPEFTDYSDVRRLMSQAMGTIIATEEFTAKIDEYNNLTDILGSKSPHRKRKDILKVEIMNWITKTRKEDWTDPPDKMHVVDPNGGAVLLSYSDKGGFRAGRI